VHVPPAAEPSAPAAGVREDKAAAPDDGQLCRNCTKPLSEKKLRENLRVCPQCGHHYPLGSWERIESLVDEDTFSALDAQVYALDALGFFDIKPYEERLREARMETGLADALVAGTCRIEGIPVALGVMDFRFLGGSMGAAVGEMFARLVIRAVEDSLPLVVCTASGGARMQEGILSLLQMAKTTVALEMLSERRLPFVCVLTDPTTGGVLASFASLADVIIAEPAALLCFAGPRVIEQTTKEKLAEGFGLAESNMEHGQLDLIVPRGEIRQRVAQVLTLLRGGEYRHEEPSQPDASQLPGRGGQARRAFARARESAVTAGRRLFGRDSSGGGPPGGAQE